MDTFEICADFQALEALLDDPAKRAVLGTHEMRVPLDSWLSTLAQVDFFLCLPGSQMPFSHHLVESMAVGTVPILEYGELMDPPLIDGINCIMYAGTEGLLLAVDKVLGLSEVETQRMRENVLAYYSNYFSAAGFVARMDFVARLALSRGEQGTLFLNLGQTSGQLAARFRPRLSVPADLLRPDGG